jgi:hypothetical protein
MNCGEVSRIIWSRPRATSIVCNGYSKMLGEKATGKKCLGMEGLVKGKRLSNNFAENSMRPVAIGRKNWIHVGSPQAGPKIAAILLVVESCRRLRFSVRDYLAAVLPGLADLPIRRLPDLTPAAWAAQRSYQTTGCWSECEVMSTIGHESHVSELNVT